MTRTHTARGRLPPWEQAGPGPGHLQLVTGPRDVPKNRAAESAAAGPAPGPLLILKTVPKVPGSVAMSRGVGAVLTSAVLYPTASGCDQ